MSEGIPVTDNFELEIEKYRWQPTEAQLKQFKLNDKYLEELSADLPFSKPFSP